MNLEKNLAEGKNFALLTQDNGVRVRRLAASTEKHILALGLHTPKLRAPSRLWRAPASPGYDVVAQFVGAAHLVKRAGGQKLIAMKLERISPKEDGAAGAS